MLYNHKIQPQQFCLILIVCSFILRMLFIITQPLLVEEAYYWNYAQHLDWSYLDHPPFTAVCIKLTTTLFGLHEWAVRLPSILAWGITMYYIYRLTELFAQGAGCYAMLLIAVLPFFFLLSIVTTPDQIMTACWSAALYYLYQTLILMHKNAWYKAGLALGIGMLTKYSILLVAVSALLYTLTDQKSKSIFKHKEPYLGALIAIILFIPVIYWNALHDWVSFAFQSTRRLHAAYQFTLHHLIGLLILFIMPLGIASLLTLYKTTIIQSSGLSKPQIHFLRIFTCVPLFIFVLFSITHPIKFNWIGPGLLALIPWLALLTQKNIQIIPRVATQYTWIATSIGLLIIYLLLLISLSYSFPNSLYKKLLPKFIDWRDLTQQFHKIADDVQQTTGKNPILLAIDTYNTNSELAFYQAQLAQYHNNQTIYPVHGNHIFGWESLMYRYWSKNPSTQDILIIISTNPADLSATTIINNTNHQTKVKWLESHSANNIAMRRYYYRTATYSLAK